MTAQIAGRASPRNPKLSMAARSASDEILDVAWRARASSTSSAVMPWPSSVTRTSCRPPSPSSTAMCALAASRAFSTSSFTSEAGRSTTSPAAI